MLCPPLPSTYPVRCTTRRVHCGITRASKISCYVPILLFRLRGSCDQSVPHWEAVSHLAGVFLHCWGFPSIPAPFWMWEAGLCMQRCLLWLLSLLGVCKQTPNAHFAARAQTGNIPPCWHWGLLTFVMGAEGIAAGGILRSHTNNFVFFG